MGRASPTPSLPGQADKFERACTALKADVSELKGGVERRDREAAALRGRLKAAQQGHKEALARVENLAKALAKAQAEKVGGWVGEREGHWFGALLGFHEPQGGAAKGGVPG